MKPFARLPAIVAAALAVAGTAKAASVDWTNWYGLTPTGGVQGVITTPFKSIAVTYTGGYDFAQLDAGQTDYWVDHGVEYNGIVFTTANSYDGGVVNRPTGSDLIAVNRGGLKTITFSQPVANPYIALLQWGTFGALISAPVTKVASGSSLLGDGGIWVDTVGDGFQGADHANGVLEFVGTYTSISFYEPSNIWWSGFTVGVQAPHVIPIPIGSFSNLALASTAAPEPATWSLMILGLGGVGLALRARRRDILAVPPL